MATIQLTINLAKITDNVRSTLSICSPLGIEVVGVTKGVSGRPEVARALIAGGIKKLGDSRLENIVRMQEAGIEGSMMLIRSPALSEIAECVDRVDTSLNVDLDVLRALSSQASKVGKCHSVILMVDLDTGREGVQPEDLPEVCREVLKMDGLSLQGLGVYFAYNSEREFQKVSLQRLATLVGQVEEECGFKFPVISGGSTNVFGNFFFEQSPVQGVNQLRIGTAILLGISSSIGPRRIQGFHQDTFVLRAELIELKKRERVFGILSLGQLDTAPEFLFPLSPGLKVVRASSDHTLVDVTEMNPRPRVGDTLAFQLGYSSLTRLMASPYTHIEFE